jgi:hypothetical protein
VFVVAGLVVFKLLIQGVSAILWQTSVGSFLCFAGRASFLIIAITTATTTTTTTNTNCNEFSLGGSSPYTNTDKTNKNKYT